MSHIKLIGKSHEVKGNQCLYCGKELDMAAGINTEDGPGTGDITVCLTCGHLMAFGEDLALRKLTDTEIVEIAGDGRLVEIQKLRAELRR
jgi:hypothetical protein